MRPRLVVIFTPLLDLHIRVRQAREPVLIQALGSQLAVKALDERIVRWLSGPAEVQRHLVQVRPLAQRLARELRTIVHSNRLRATTLPGKPRQDRRQRVSVVPAGRPYSNRVRTTRHFWSHRLTGGRPTPRTTPGMIELGSDEIDRAADELLLLTKSRSAPIATATRLCREFGSIVRGRDETRMREWIRAAMAQVDSSAMASFATGLHQTREEVCNAMKHDWSNGRAEGHVNRIKMIKRKMYGRANFDLLRIRVLAGWQ